MQVLPMTFQLTDFTGPLTASDKMTFSSLRLGAPKLLPVFRHLLKNLNLTYL